MKTLWIVNHYATPPSYGGLSRHHYFSRYLKDKYNVKIIASSAIHNSDVNFIDGKELYYEHNIDNVDYIIKNDGTLKELYSQIDAFLMMKGF